MILKKKISIAIEEFRLAVQNAANDSGLPACVLEVIMYSMHQELIKLSAIELQKDLAEMKEGEKDGNTDKAGK